MTDSNRNPEPMIKLEPSGVAPVISYNVPEPTSYSGRNFIDLQLGASYFKTTPPPGSSSLTASGASLTSGPDATDALASLIMEAAATERATYETSDEMSLMSPAAPRDGGSTETLDLRNLLAGLKASGHEISDKLLNLNLDEVRAMRRLGKRLNIYRTMFGTLAYNYVDAPAVEPETSAASADDFSAFAPLAATSGETETDPIFRPIEPEETDGDVDQNAIPEPPPEGGGGGGGGTTTVALNVRIDVPAANSTLNGPHSGMSFTVTGVSSVTSGGGSISKVEVQVGSGEFKIASQTSGTGWNTWAILGNVSVAGPLTITARATHSTGKTTTHAVNVNVALAPPPDTTAPGLNISFPSAGQEFPGTSAGSAIVNVTGTASDLGGVQTVELKLDNGNYSQVTPGHPDWSNWSKVVNVPSAGEHTLTARCVDNAGNVTTKSVTLRVTVAPPPDTTLPTINISTPVQNASINGPFNGASVNVKGSASDASGINKVELLVDGVITPAQPKGANDWSEWSGTVIVKQPGLRHITARCTDSAGNTNTSTVAVNVTLIPDVVSRLNRLILVESYRLSSYLGGYGAGRTIKTFSLLPGEKTKISIKTYTKTEADAKSASSILDSFTQESSDDFESSMGKEQSNKKNYDESFNYKVDATASASWGWGSASVSGGVSGGTNSAREEFAKNIANATQKHAARASAKRDVQINTSYEVKESTGEETSVERVIENINVSRTLNFVFRQMNQEFITILHLVDVRVGYFKVVQVQGQTEPQYTYKEVTLPELDALLEEAIVPEKRAEVRADIIRQLSNIFDHKDRRHQFVQEEPMRDHNGQIIPLSQYLRVRKDYVSSYLDEATGTLIKVPGIILDASKYVLRTEGVIVEALLGQGDALDAYSHGLQDAAVREKNLANERAALDNQKAELALQIIQTNDAEAAKLYAQLNPQPHAQLVPYVLASPKESTNGQPVN
ncbi:MAG TPA: Ig-like domain-containing protein [Pyrinomonadaceae bacterium]|nr:Ig-like domain-containing protein [Pyrinomonadaceae bacterium]